MYKKIIVGLSLEHGIADRALRTARALGGDGAEILAVHVAEPLQGSVRFHIREEDMQKARAQMEAGGTMISLELEGGKEAAFRMLNALRIFVISNNLGDAKSIVTHPATTTHQRLTPQKRDELGITPGMVRFSLGIEDCDDLLGDVENALDAV